VIVTDNVVGRGNSIGLSVSNKEVKNNVFWGYNTVGECSQWGAQLQGETGGIARHYFYRCVFEKTVRGDAKAIYPGDSGHGFRFNGASREVAFEDCLFEGNGGFGVQYCGDYVDKMTFLRCIFRNNGLGSVLGRTEEKTIAFPECRSEDKYGWPLSCKQFAHPAPAAGFAMPESIRAGVAARFTCTSRAGSGDIVERLWDFNHGIAEVEANPEHVLRKPGSIGSR